MDHVDVYEHRSDKAPPLVIRGVDQGIQLGAIRDKNRFWKAVSQRSQQKPARIPHQKEDENVYDEKNDCEFVRAVDYSSREANRFTVGAAGLSRAL